MTRTTITLAALLALTAGTALAGELEPPHEPAEPVWLAIYPPEPKGYGALVTSEADGGTSPAAVEPSSMVRYPDSERPKFDRDK
jgi:hypothetical protein